MLPAGVIEDLDAALAVDEAQARVIAALESGVQKSVNLAVAALLRDFSKLTPEQKETVLASLEDEVGKFLSNDELLTGATAHVPRDDDSIAATTYRRMKRS